MLSNLFRPLWNKIVQILGETSVKLGITPDFWTLVGLLLSFGSMILLGRGNLIWGAIFMFLMLFADGLDGATARASGTGNRFGTVLDHVVDRYSEFIVFIGLFMGDWFSDEALMFALSGMIMASYVRAKAESAGQVPNCTVGIAGRVEKLLLIYGAIILLLFDLSLYAEIMIWILGVISHITAIWRLLYSRKAILNSEN